MKILLTTSGDAVTETAGFDCVINNGCGSAICARASLTVYATPSVTITPSGTTTFCNGGSVTLTASGAATYNWSPATGLDTTGAAVVNADPASTTTYTVTGVNSSGCKGTASVTITVNPLPTATVSGTAAICSNQSTTIYAALTGTGPWTVIWSDGTNQSGVITSPASRVVIPSASTTYMVTSISDANCSGGTSSGSAVISVSGGFAIDYNANRRTR